MDFFIKYDPNYDSRIEIRYCTKLNQTIHEANIIFIEKLKHLDYIEQKSNEVIQLAFGDVIRFHDNIIDLSDCKGLFYLLNISNQHNLTQIRPDGHSLLPIYYTQKGNIIYISSSYYFLASILENKTKNPDFYKEFAIFYTQLSRATFFNEINKLNYGEFIELDGSFNIKVNHRFYKFFTTSPKSFKSSIDDIVQKFIDVSKYYLNNPCAIALTGGFDGRTITGCAHYHKCNFINFSYGRKGNGDVDTPILIANRLGLKYRLIELEQDYIDNDYFNCVEEYIKYSGGLNGFQYPQSLYYAKKIAAENNIIVTGYLGSEVLANAKNSDDEIYSQAVIDYLSKGNLKSNNAYKLIKVLKQLKLLENEKEITNLMEKIEAYFLLLPSNLTNNQMFAVFSFENVFRNTFGVWIYNSMHYAKIRVPFIDKEFFETVSKTEVSQFYRRFLDNNPLNRIHGQMLYPHILRRIWPELNAINSSKSYPPKDILSIYGRSKIAIKLLTNPRSHIEMHGLDRMRTIAGSTKYLNNQTAFQHGSNFDKNIIINLMNNNSIYRSLCFLALTKSEAEKILNT
jgi:asparagine synthetase B (glutamine-hydrolysing)